MKARMIVVLSVLVMMGFVGTGLAHCGSCAADAPKKEVKQDAKKKANKDTAKKAKKTKKVKKDKKEKNAAASCKACPCPIGNVLATLDLEKKQQVKIDKARQRLMTTIQKTLTPEQMKQFKKACSKMKAAPAGCGQ